MRHRQIRLEQAKLINNDGHVIGLDIGATAVRAAVMSLKIVDGRPAVTAQGLGHVRLPVGAVRNGIICDPSAVTRAVKSLWHEHHFAGRNVILGVTNSQVVVREVQLPNLPQSQRAKALPFQAKDVIALPIDQAILDFAPIGPPDLTTDTVPGLLIAAPREPVSIAVRVVENAGLKVARVDLASFAALRATGTGARVIEAIVDLGAHLTNIVIHRDGIPQLVRTIVRGSNELTTKLARQLEIDIETAEQVKRTVGLSDPGTEVGTMLAELVRPLLAEIRSSVNVFAAAHASLSPERILLTGGGALLPGLTSQLAQMLEIPVEVAEPMRHVGNRGAAKSAHSVASDDAVSAVSVGLAMGAAA